ncbi:glycosyltransferase family 2 protein [Allofrancisella guangzhouensis]|uniref:Glycosyl transferase n=1 Tax=Allofrancisella guangzhouensis TaxID=594679 RepID=A0A0A8E3T9_9GAMM|nr:glycosyltransferase family 2 protein [Allofrancisella guangzhouensis]AJC48648.1 glycosyl transferase [Allofrancisella guangzhouensis]MBK2044756.1 glycosyltransferase family 2 protein [Allofrancisella guangzhouensis]MBK2045870.1 glycosyltransferase family 2 protein [Allofrancisella guangzhouensis]
MKKILFILAVGGVFYFLSFLNKSIVFSVFISLLLLFLFYAYITAKEKASVNLLTFLYVGFSFLFAFYACFEVLNTSYTDHPFVTIVILSVLLPTFFLLGYRIILSLHCLFESVFSAKKVVVEQKSVEYGCSIVITTRNEPFNVCKMTFDSAHKLDHPVKLKEIVVVDNSDLSHQDFIKWQEYVKGFDLVDGMRCKFIHREGTEGFKPRNLDIAMQHISFNYVLFLDADSTLPANSLKIGLPEFNKNPKLGFVSFLIESTNYNVNLVTKIISIFQNTIRYFNEFVGQRGYCNYQGHNGIWSIKALQATSKWEEYYKSQVMVTEDIAAGFRCYEAGFESKPIFLKTGEWVPISLREFEKMWLRWSFGGMQVMHKYMSRIIGSPNLCFRVKLDMLYLLFKVIASGFPLFALILVTFPRSDPALVALINITLLPLIILSIWYYIYGYLQGSILSKIYQIYISMFILSSFVFWCGIKAEINYYLNKPQGWKPTSKVLDKVDGWSAVLYNNFGKLIFSTIGLIVASISICRFYSSAEFMWYLLCMVPSILLFMNTILCIFILGRAKY